MGDLAGLVRALWARGETECMAARSQQEGTAVGTAGLHVETHLDLLAI